ncbi:MAG: hypothetical protein Q9167_003990 [Letrouitia subvulpina]
MGPPPASRNFEQICDSYPPGTCLRELLQNADDANATEIEYVLDSHSYDDEELLLLHEGLRQYHGPALLARNNSVFTDEDFDSLSSIGDSRKRQDIATAGKFGQGFNSCFHWTDGPWVYSRQWLLLLDPHRSWSRDTNEPGGPAWDVVQDQQSIEIKSHMKTFQSFEIDPSKPLLGTIIRIPLRTVEQAMISKISDRHVTVDQILDALTLLGQEIRQGGNLFLKNIRRITARLDSRVIWNARIEGHNSSSSQLQNKLPLRFRELYAKEDAGVHQPVSETLELDIHFTGRDDIPSTSSYVLQHLMLSSTGDKDLDHWGRSKKLFPWVALAAPIGPLPSQEPFKGHLFSILKLPIETNQPVHIHGLFSITPDRGRLSSQGQPSGYGDMESKWNDYIFSECVARVWADLLFSRRDLSWKEENFKLWPQIEDLPTHIWNKLDNFVINQILHRRLPVWNTFKECVQVQCAYIMIVNSTIEKYIASFEHVELPVTRLDAKLNEKLKQHNKSYSIPLQYVISQNFRKFLKLRQPLQIVAEFAPSILEFCLLDIESSFGNISGDTLIQELRGLVLWPSVDCSLIAYDGSKLLLPRNDEELALFTDCQPSKTVDLKRLTPRVRSQLHSRSKALTSMFRSRELSDLTKDWPELYKIEHSLSDNLLAPRLSGADNDAKIRRTWDWICSRVDGDRKIPQSVERLWLLPVSSSYIRQVACAIQGHSVLVVTAQDFFQDLIQDIASCSPGTPLRVLDADALSPQAIKVLRDNVRSNRKLGISTTDDLRSLVPWLVSYKDAIVRVSVSKKVKLLSHLKTLAIREENISSANYQALTKQIKKLPLFSRVHSNAPYHDHSILKSDLMESKLSIERPLNLPPVPIISDTSLFDFSDPDERFLVDHFKLVERLPLERFLFEYLLPMTINIQDANLDHVKYRIADFVIDNCQALREAWIDQLQGFAIIPLRYKEDNTRHYRKVIELVEPDTPLAELYFENENVFPDTKFFKKHQRALSACGLRNDITEEIILDRIRTYSQRGKPLDKTRDKVKCLFALCPNLNMLNESSILEIRRLSWLPVSCTWDQNLILMSSKDCRGVDQRDLVDSVMGCLDATLSHNWKMILGWNEPIDMDVLVQQLDNCVAKGRHRSMDQLLSHLSEAAEPSILRPTLHSRKCLLSSNRTYIMPENAFLPGGLLKRHSLAPFLEEIDTDFASNHSDLLQILEIRSEPLFHDLLKLQQSILSSTNDGSLSQDRALDLTMSLLEIAAALYANEENFVELLVPDTEQKYRKLSDIVHGDRSLASTSTMTFHFTHARISTDLAERLNIEDLSTCAIRLGIDFEDDDDDEYVPREKFTTIICDTLSRYPIESTFNEFLANADDSHATKMSWILDDCKDGSYSDSMLLTPEMAQYQGPALFSYNNGVFSKKDFEGFKDIGQGGKADDVTSTGMFGRGSMTMYHFTQNPTILSGNFILFLHKDPRQQSLPRNKKLKRKIGVKISLETARRLCVDQLVPFEGLGDYSKDLDYYPGTLFRLPLDPSNPDKSERMNVRRVTKLLEHYFESARLSLLFLQHVDYLSFNIRSEPTERWQIRAHRTASSDVFQTLNLDVCRQEGQICEEEWHIGMTDIEESPAGLVNPSKGELKLTECGIAACTAHNQTQREPSESLRKTDVKQKIFCKLPTSYDSNLPVSLHASFAITGDRRTIPIQQIEKDSHAAWNHWLLSSCIPDLYLELLNYLASRLGDSVFRFWPHNGSIAMESHSNVVEAAFWERLGNQKYIDYQLWPVVTTDARTNETTPLKTRPGKSRKLYNVTSLRWAVFNILEPKASTKLQPLLARLCPTLVRPPMKLLKYLNKDCPAEITSLTSSYLCSLFKSEKSCLMLEELLKSFKRDREPLEMMERLLEAVVSETSVNATSLEILDGCRILPKRDGSLGLIRKEPCEASQLMFVLSQEEEELFNFKPEKMIDTRLFRSKSSQSEGQSTRPAAKTLTRLDPVNQILASGLFNVTKLSMSYVHLFLEQTVLAEIPDKGPWTKRFWSYCNWKLLEEEIESSSRKSGISVQDIYQQCGFRDYPIYRVLSGDKWTYVTPKQFQEILYVVKPSTPSHVDICRSIKGLSLVDSSCIPYWLEAEESDLTAAASFYRLQERLLDISKASGIPVKKLFDQTFTSDEAEVLRSLLRRYVSDDKNKLNQAVLQALPIWPSFSSTPQEEKSITLKSASTAHLCKYDQLLMPWVKELDRFVIPKVVREDERTLARIGSSILTVQQVWNLIQCDLPDYIDEDYNNQYIKLLKCLADGQIKGSYRMAPNGFLRLCRPQKLYDHEDEIFQAAFRGKEKNRFLHESVRPLRQFWLKNGLRHRSGADGFSGDDYSRCVQAIAARWGSSSPSDIDIDDAFKVSSYLQNDWRGFRNWSKSVWDTVTTSRIFRVQDDLSREPSYCHRRMQNLAQRWHHCSLNETASAKYKRILWSQRPCPKHCPTPSVYQRLADGEKPPVATVADHLKYLIGIRNEIDTGCITRYLKDVQESYSFLQDHSSETKLLAGLREAEIWLNLKSTELETISHYDLEGSLTSAKFLCFNSPADPFPFKNANEFLIPYKTLLRALGCQSVVQRETAVTAGDDKATPSEFIVSGYQRLREWGIGFDVTFEAEGKQIAAHKTSMMVVSKYCQAQFSGPWGELLERKASIVLEDVSFASLRIVVKFAYTATVEWIVISDKHDNERYNEEVADRLDEILDLLSVADRFEMERLHRLTELHLLQNCQTFIRADNVRGVLERAREAQARRIERHCEGFISDNIKFVEIFDNMD